MGDGAKNLLAPAWFYRGGITHFTTLCHLASACMLRVMVDTCVCMCVCVFRLIQRTGNGQANIKSGFRNRNALATKADGLTVGRMNKKSV